MSVVAIAIFVIQAVNSDDLQRLAAEISTLQEALKEHCVEECIEKNQSSPDLKGAALATKAAELREQRILLLAADSSISPVDIAGERVSAASVRMDAFSLAPTTGEQMDRALILLLEAERDNIDSQNSLARKIHAAYLRYYALASFVPPPVAPRPEVDPIDEPDPRPKRSNVANQSPILPTPSAAQRSPKEVRGRRGEGYLTVRIEGGYGQLFVGNDNTDSRGERFSAGYINASVHGRFPYKRIAVLMGPYFAWLRAGTEDYALAWDMGARLELEIYTSAKAKEKRRVSIHPFAEAGLGLVRPNPVSGNKLWTSEVGGISAASGLAVCFVHALICPVFRVKMIPDVDSQVDVIPQVGLAISLGNYR